MGVTKLAIVNGVTKLAIVNGVTKLAIVNGVTKVLEKIQDWLKSDFT